MKASPFSQACENNKAPILDVLIPVFAGCKKVLEIGSGTGQHAVHFAAHLQPMQWQPTDQPEYLEGIELWRDHANLANLLPVLPLDVRQHGLPEPKADFDAVFSANTLHIMAWTEVETTFSLLSELNVGTKLCVYGPFNYGGTFTSESNARFNASLLERNVGSGLRDFEAVDQLAQAAGFQLQRDYEMPANNRLLYWLKGSAGA